MTTFKTLCGCLEYEVDASITTETKYKQQKAEARHTCHICHKAKNPKTFGILHTLAIENSKWMVMLLGFQFTQGFLNFFRIALPPVTSSEIRLFTSCPFPLFVFIAFMTTKACSTLWYGQWYI